MNIYYVYAYLRSKTSTYGPKFSPYYIGKGCGKRLYEKHSCSIPSNPEMIVILLDNLSEEDAFKKEIELISLFGRIDKGTGILRNLTDGGEGASGRIVSEKSRKKSSNSNRGLQRSDRAKENIRNGLSKVDLSGENNHFFGKTHTEESKLKMSLSKKGKTFEEIYGDKAEEKRIAVSQKMKGRKRGPQTTLTCPHCGKSGGKSIMKRWHFDKCKVFNDSYSTDTDILP